MADPYGRAVRDWYHDRQDSELILRDGEETREHPIEEFYFAEFDADSEAGEWLASWLEGPALDMGAGAGRHALHFQEEFEVVAVENSEHLVEVMDERGVEDARYADMFSLRDAFEPDRFQSALSIGTQLGLVGSRAGLRKFLSDLAFVTTDDATAVIDGYDPDLEATKDLLGYREDPGVGLAHRVMHFEYEDEVGETLLFRLFNPERLREAAVNTAWDVVEVRHGPDDDPDQWRAALEKDR